MHLSAELFAAVRRGDLDSKRFAELVTDHLLDLCEHCRAELEAYRTETGGPFEPRIVAFAKLVEENAPRLLEEEERARQDMRKLLRLPAGERYGRVMRARTHFRGTLFAQLALEEARASLPAQPERALDFAKIAQASVFLNPDSKPAVAAFVLSTAHLANAHRALGELLPAARMFELTRRLLLANGVTDLRTYAEIYSLESSLRKDERHLAQARELLNTAATLYRILEDPTNIAKTLINLAEVSREQGNLDEAIQTATQALANLQPERDPRLYLCARHNLTLYQLELGQLETARELLDSDLSLYERFDDPWTKARLYWLLGKVCHGMGRFEDSENAFRSARDIFLERHHGYDTALVSLDLALVYLDAGKTSALKKLASALPNLLRTHGLHDEAIAALLLFEQAAQRESVTADLVQELSVYLEAARRNPALKFTRLSDRRRGR